MKQKLSVLLVGFACVALTGGCISHQTTVHRDVERTKVQFESEKAARVFYEKLSRMPTRNSEESKTEFSIPVVFDYSRKVVVDNNERFNEAVRICDTNQDGKITETEANIFAAQP